MTTIESVESSPRENWLNRALGVRLNVNLEVLVFVGILILALFTRFYDLESRVMSHDETTHVYFSWLLEQGSGYQHDPLSHGPFQFHLIALSYFLFGDTDATARFPAAAFGVLAIGLLWVFRRWLGRVGGLAAAGLMLVSPYMLYYSRYARNESLVIPEALLMFWAVFRYVETRKPRWLYLLAFSLSLHFATKETAYIYTAQLLVFLGAWLAWRWLNHDWKRPGLRITYIFGLIASAIGIGVGVFAYFRERAVAQPATQEAVNSVGAGPGLSPVIAIAGLLALMGLILVAIAVLMEFGRQLRSQFPLLDMLIIIGTLTLPQLSAFPANLLGWDPLAYQDPAAYTKTVITIILLVVISAAVGMAWRWKEWIIAMGVFAIPFVLLFSTFFTNGQGIATGLVGSLGYWIVQHGVNRGNQPYYYYALVQLPVYEYLPVLGSILAGYLGLRALPPGIPGGQTSKEPSLEAEPTSFPVIPFLGYWCVTSLLAFSFAGERMPWLTVHITFPFILLAGWGIGKFVRGVDWSWMKTWKAWLATLLLFVMIISLLQALGGVLGSNPPFAGRDLNQLSATIGFLGATFTFIAAFVGLILVARDWRYHQFVKLSGILFLGILTFLTARAAFRAAYINYDEPTEFLVYAHSARGPKTALEQIEELSYRTTGTKDIQVAYDNETTYPFWWYLRNYRNAFYFASSPSRELLNYPLILAGDANWAKIDSLLRAQYHSFTYKRIWWPIQDYFDLTWERVWEAVSSPEYRSALWDIWLNRDYDQYSQIVGRDLSQRNWQPSNEMKLYIRRDMAALIWDFGLAPAGVELEEFADPYEGRILSNQANQILGGPGEGVGEFSRPRDIAVGIDGSLYVADSGNHRIQRLSPSGEVLEVWGGFSESAEGPPATGTFNEPWGIGIAPDGSVYVADTWNHRIQKFSPEGEFLTAFGFFGQAEQPEAFWGPRDVVIDEQGNVYVSDTGNKRVVIFNADHQPIGSFGGFGIDAGSLDEPVGLALDDQGRLYVADTWNQRVQVFESRGSGVFHPILEWSIEGWYGQSLNNKPYISASGEDRVCVSDPESYRILCFDESGEFIVGWGSFGAGSSQFELPTGVDFDGDGRLWVVDSENGRLMRFDLPAEAGEE